MFQRFFTCFCPCIYSHNKLSSDLWHHVTCFLSSDWIWPLTINRLRRAGLKLQINVRDEPGESEHFSLFLCPVERLNVFCETVLVATVDQNQPQCKQLHTNTGMTVMCFSAASCQNKLDYKLAADANAIPHASPSCVPVASHLVRL